jgi:hypothetical protein
MYKSWKVLTLRWRNSERDAPRQILYTEFVLYRYSIQNVLSIECVLYRMCSLWNVLSMECVLYGMCSLWNVFSIECVLYR